MTAAIDQIESTTRLTQPVNVIDERDLKMRAKSVVAHIANEEVGLHLQRTSPVMDGYLSGCSIDWTTRSMSRSGQ